MPIKKFFTTSIVPCLLRDRLNQYKKSTQFICTKCDKAEALFDQIDLIDGKVTTEGEIKLNSKKETKTQFYSGNQE